MLTRMAPLLTRMARMARLLTRMARMLTRMSLAGSHIIHTPREFIIIHFKQNFVRDSDKCRFSGITGMEGWL